MAVSTRMLRWLGTIVATVASLGLIVLIAAKDLNTAATAASVVGAIAGIATAVFAAIPLLQNPGTSSGPGTRRVLADRRGIAAGGGIVGNAIGAQAKVVGPSAPSANATETEQGHRDVRATRDGIAAGDDIAHNAIGDGSTVE